MKRTLCLLLALALLLGAAYAEETDAANAAAYAQAEQLMRDGRCSEASARFEALGAYADAAQMAVYCKGLSAAEDLLLYDTAVELFLSLSDFRDSARQAEYYQARGQEAAGDAVNAATASDQALSDGREAYARAQALYAGLEDFRDSPQRLAECQRKSGVLDAEIAQRTEEWKESTYQRAVQLQKSGKYLDAMALYRLIPEYKDSAERVDDCRAGLAGSLRFVMAAGPRHTVGLRKNGSVVAVGSKRYLRCNTAGWKGIAAVAAGWAHTVGLRKSGTVVAVGDNSQKQCATRGWSGITAVAAGDYHTVGLRKNGTVVAVGWNNEKQCSTGKWKNIAAIAAGGCHTVGLRKNGTVAAVGWNDQKQCATGSWKNIAAIAAGWKHTVGLRKDGTVVATGWNAKKQCATGSWKNIIAIAAGRAHTVGLRRDGTVIAAGSNDCGQCDVQGWTDIVAVAASWDHTIGLKSDGTVVAAGDNTSGQCNVGKWNLLK